MYNLLIFSLFLISNVKDYFPFAVGNKWKYQHIGVSEGAIGIKHSVEHIVVDSLLWKGNVCYKVLTIIVDEESGETLNVYEEYFCEEEYVPNKYRIKHCREVSGAFKCWIELIDPLKIGDEQPKNEDELNVDRIFWSYFYSVEEILDEYKKKYKNCIVIEEKSMSERIQGVEPSWRKIKIYAKGIGLVFEEYKDEHGTEQSSLVEYSIKKK